MSDHPGGAIRVKASDLGAVVRGAVEYEQDVSLRDALTAVLGLHKPNPHPSGLGPYCEKCVGGYEGVSEWPCETVLAVAKELGVEVEHG